MMMFKFLLITLLCLAHQKSLKAQGELVTPSPSPSLVLKPVEPVLTPAPSQSPSPSPSPSPFLFPTTRPSRKPVPTAPGRRPSPTNAVGNSLGWYGRELPAFWKRCKRCCWQTKRKGKKNIPLLRRCDRCKLNTRLNPGNSGRCKEGAFLGWERNPSPCFYDRCHKMLVSRGPCMCVQ